MALIRRRYRYGAQSVPTGRAIRYRHRGDRHVANYRISNLCHERHGQLSGLTQRVNNKLFRVAGVLRVQKRSNRYGSNCCNIGRRLIGNLNFHRERQTDSDAEP